MSGFPDNSPHNPPESPSGTGADRRCESRHSLTCPCKVYHPATARYAAGATVNISAGGAFLHLRPSRPLTAGETLTVAIAGDDRPLIRGERMAEAQILRVGAFHGGRQSVAVRFLDRQPSILPAGEGDSPEGRPSLRSAVRWRDLSEAA